MAVLVVLAVTVLFFMALEALSVAVAGVFFLDFGFWDAWHAAWDRPGLLLLFALITLLLMGND